MMAAILSLYIFSAQDTLSYIWIKKLPTKYTFKI